jgi:tripartite-type tricarboxylate transporter receptor subunit TctC
MQAILRLLCLLVPALLAAPAVHAQAFPSKPVRIVIPFPPGGPSDVLARLIGQKLSERWGQVVIPDNRAGANTIIGTEALVKAPADGHTLLLTVDSTVTVNPAVYSKLSYVPARDLMPVTLVAWSRTLIVVNGDSGPRNLPELVQTARAQPGKVTFGAGTITSRLAGELLKRRLGLDMVFVPYKGSAQAVQGLLSGDVTFLVVATSAAIPHIRSGRFRAIATTGAQPIASLPNVPTVGEAINLPGFDSSVWLAAFVPAGTPAGIVQKLNEDIAQVLSRDDVRTQLGALGLDPATSSPKELAELIRKESELWTPIIHEAAIRAD